jgi:hypothetical protein
MVSNVVGKSMDKSCIDAKYGKELNFTVQKNTRPLQWWLVENRVFTLQPRCSMTDRLKSAQSTVSVSSLFFAQL